MGEEDLLLGKEEGALTEGVGIARQVVDSKDTAHGDLIVCIRERKGKKRRSRRREKRAEQEATTRVVDKGG